MNGPPGGGLAAALRGDAGQASSPRLPLVTAACLDLLDVSGAAVVLMTRDCSRHVACTVGPVMRDLESLEVTLGEGPFVDAFTTGRPALEADLGHRCSRWPMFGPQAVALGVRAAFALPLQVKDTRLGTLDLYRDRPGMLATEELAVALALADVVTDVVLDLQSQVPRGELHGELVDAKGLFQARVHQAAGMVAAQLDVTVNVAMARLRAYAFVQDQPLPEVAELVVEGRVRLG